jgi:diaminopimelate epimerase
MKSIHFYKYHGTGNDFIIIDNRHPIQGIADSKFVRKMCHRRFGIGADGLMLLESSTDATFTMRYFNSDGGESTMCGNGGRCIAAFAVHLGVAPKDVLFEFNAVDGFHFAKVEDNLVSLKMLDVDGIVKTKEGYFLNTGSPHVVVLSDDVIKVDVFKQGQLIRHDERFKPGGGTNVNFLTIKEAGSLAVRTFERGVEDETWSCGTGSVASAMVANYLEGTRNAFDVEVPGGKLKVKFDVIGNGIYRNVWLEGPAAYVYEGDFRI